MADVLRSGHPSRARVRAGGLLLVGAALVAGAFGAVPASAQLQLPPLPPLPLPTLLPEVDLEATTGALTDALADVAKIPLQVVEGATRPPATAKQPALKPVLRPRGPIVDSWSVDLLPGLTGATEHARTAVSSSRVPRPGSYTSAVSGGFRAAVGRAAKLAGPLAAPLAVALFAVGLLVVAAKSPTRLVKVEEDRRGFREPRSYRL